MSRDMRVRSAPTPFSPLLANIALHGMEEALSVTYDQRGQIKGKRAVVRYADDFVVFCETREDAEAAQQCLAGWLGRRGLELSAEKTRIVHITEGFDFLGFTVKQYEAPTTSRTGYKLLITPSKTSVEKLRKTMHDTWRQLQGHNVRAVIKRLTPVIRGWANYFRTGVAKQTFRDLDNWMYQREVRYVQRMHPTKPWKWHRARYWGQMNSSRHASWVFGDKQTGAYLPKFSWFPIERHILVKGAASPDDPTLRDYWKMRTRAQAQDLIPSEQRIARNQDYRCPVCRQSLFNGEEMQVHHRIPRKQGGANCYSNLLLVHLYCHQQLHRARTPQTDGGNKELSA